MVDGAADGGDAATVIDGAEEETGADARDDRDDPFADAASDTALADVILTCGSPDYPCDPVTNTGCAPPQTCQMAGFPLPTRPHCAAPGTSDYDQPCSASTGPQCAAGLACVDNACLPACCPVTDAQCGTHAGFQSRCAISTGFVGLKACTVPGECDYVHQLGCPSGAYCYATTPLGNGTCLAPGSVPAFGQCRSLSDCVYGFTCVGSPTGTCRQICNPRGPNTCGTGEHCGEFVDRPGDYGACGP